jgi:carbamoylphosphate synthase small subunit
MQSKMEKNKKNFVFREGMLKMKDVYAQNPALGDPNSLDKKLDENGEKLTHKPALGICLHNNYWSIKW